VRQATFEVTIMTMRATIGEAIPLPMPATGSDVPVEAALAQRRSVRDFTEQALSLADVGQLLWSAQGVTDLEGARTTPSAGALYPLDAWLVASRVKGLEPGFYRYEAASHRLWTHLWGDLAMTLGHAAEGQTWMARAPVVIVLTAAYSRTTRKYGQRARRYVHMEAGHAAQNVYLQSQTLGLGATEIGAFDDDEVRRLLRLPQDARPLALIPVGHY
jgi:SagB-type dehydrogenase family enzyme